MKLPIWMLEDFENNVCPYCKEPLKEKGVKCHGIREERSKSKKKIRLIHFYEYKCNSCKNLCTFSFPTSYSDFIKDVSEIASHVTPSVLNNGSEPEMDSSVPYPLSDPKKSGISDEEVAEAKKTLDESEDLKDFLGKIGIVKTGTNPRTQTDDLENK